MVFNLELTMHYLCQSPSGRTHKDSIHENNFPNKGMHNTYIWQGYITVLRGCVSINNQETRDTGPSYRIHLHTGTFQFHS